MSRAPRTFTLVLGLIVLALLLALTLNRVLSTRLGRDITGSAYGQLGAATVDAVDAATRSNAVSVAQLRAAMVNSGVLFTDAAPPPQAREVTPAVAAIAAETGRLLGDPSRVSVRQIGDHTQFWVRSANQPGMWIVLQAPRYRRAIINSAATVAVLAGLIALVVAALVARLLTRPLERLAGAAPALLDGEAIDDDLRNSPCEVRHLAAAIAAAGARQRDAARERELMLAGISHDLRTPLARLRIALELGDAGDSERREAMVADLAELDHALEQCLAYVRDGSDETARSEDIVTVVGQLLALREHPESWQCDAPATLFVHARQGLLRRAVANLMDNAERYGAAPFAIAMHRDGSNIHIHVDDSGPGVAAELLPRLGRPFVRGDAARGGGGNGLGIGIAMRAAALHGGKLELRNRDGGGFSAELVVPGATHTTQTPA